MGKAPDEGCVREPVVFTLYFWEGRGGTRWGVLAGNGLAVDG